MFKVFKKSSQFIIACESMSDYAINQDGELLRKNTWIKDAYDKIPNQDDFIVVNMEEITDKCLKVQLTFGDNEIKIYKHNDMYLGCDKKEWFIICDLKQFLYNMCH